MANGSVVIPEPYTHLIIPDLTLALILYTGVESITTTLSTGCSNSITASTSLKIKIGGNLVEIT